MTEEMSMTRNRHLIKIPLGINLKDEFETYEEFDRKLKEVSRKHFVHFWKRDCRTVEGAKKKTERYIDPKIKYYQLKYSCVHGGRMFKRKNETISDSKTECEANFYLIATPDGSKLFVKSLNNYHNHEVSEATYFKYFIEEKNRRGRPRTKSRQVKREIKDEYTSGYLYGHEMEMDETNMQIDNNVDYPIDVDVQQYDTATDHSAMLQYDANLCNQDMGLPKEDDVDQFVKYLGSELRQIKNRKVTKKLKRTFIAMVQKAQDEEDSA